MEQTYYKNTSGYMPQKNNMADASDADAKHESRPWTDTELKHFAIVLSEKKDDFAYKLDTLRII